MVYFFQFDLLGLMYYYTSSDLGVKMANFTCICCNSSFELRVPEDDRDVKRCPDCLNWSAFSDEEWMELSDCE